MDLDSYVALQQEHQEAAALRELLVQLKGAKKRREFEKILQILEHNLK